MHLTMYLTINLIAVTGLSAQETIDTVTIVSVLQCILKLEVWLYSRNSHIFILFFLLMFQCSLSQWELIVQFLLQTL